MKRDDAGDDHDESAGGAANLRLGAAEQRNQETGDDSAVDTGLRGQSGGDGKSHGQRQGDQAHRDAGNEIVKKFVGVVVPQTKDRLREPTFIKESIGHFSIMQQASVEEMELGRSQRTKEHGRSEATYLLGESPRL